MPFLSRRELLQQAATLLSVGAVTPAWAARQGRTRVGFIDDNLENYHANTFLALLRGPLQSSGFTVAGCTGLQEAPSWAWATRNNVPYVTDVAALNQTVDAFMVMAPGTPTPFAATLTTRKGTRHITVDQGPMFQNSLSATLDFFTSGTPGVPSAESLGVTGILDTSRNQEARVRFVPVTRN